MDQFKIDFPTLAMRSRFIKYNGYGYDGLFPIPDFIKPEDWEFAIAEVEGKPVFPYKEGLYAIGGGRFIPASAVPTFRVLSDENGYTFKRSRTYLEPTTS